MLKNKTCGSAGKNNNNNQNQFQLVKNMENLQYLNICPNIGVISS